MPNLHVGIQKHDDFTSCLPCSLHSSHNQPFSFLVDKEDDFISEVLLAILSQGAVESLVSAGIADQNDLF